MKNELQIFTNEVFGKVRTVKVEDKIYFVGKDVAEALGYKSPKNAISRHCKGGIEMSLPSNGGQQAMKVIPEGDMYRLIFKSNLPNAQKFEEWVMDYVLPKLRQEGKFELQVNPPTELEEIATNTLLQIAYESNKLVGNIDKLDNYYIPKHKTKLAYNKIIKQCLAYNDSKENCKLAKEILLLRLGNYSIYEEVPVDVLNSTQTIALIYDICKNINISIGGVA